MRHSLRRFIIATAAIIGLSNPAVIAAPAEGSASTASQPGKTQPHPARDHDRAANIEQRITDLRTRLQITPAQQPQWDQFTQVMRDNARNMEDTFKQRVKIMPTMTAPENMQSYAQVASSHAQDVQKLVPVFQSLYDTMSDSQKRTADQIFRDEAHHPRRG